MDVLAALLPPVVVGGAFIAIVVAVKRRADAEEKRERDAEYRPGFDREPPEIR